ncbi:MAG: alpha/beta hydrolase [Bacteroidota bacterium]
MKQPILDKIQSVWRTAYLPEKIDVFIDGLETRAVAEWMPGETHYTRNGDVSICYETIGVPERGTVIVLSGFMQTLLGYPQHLHEGFVAAGYRVVRMDNRGVGMSSWIKDWTRSRAYTLEDMASDVVAVMDDLGLAEAHILGISMGGMIAQTLAIQYPKRVKSLISMMSSGHFFDPELMGVSNEFRGKFTVISLLHGIDSSSIRGQLRLRSAIFGLFRGSGNYEMDIYSLLDKTRYELVRRRGYNKEAFQQHATAVRKSGARYADLKQLKVPTLIIHGKDDPLINITHSYKCAAIMPQAKTLYLDGMGHDVPNMYMPEINKAILEVMAS